MCKRVILGLFVLSAIALVYTEAHAGCLPNVSPPYCASWITGSGNPTGLVTAETSEPLVLACPAVTTTQGPEPVCVPGECQCPGECEGIGILQVSPAINLRLVGTVPTTDSPHCGLVNPADQFCRIEGVALCGTSPNKKAETPGPLRVTSPDGFGQTDGSTDSANFRLQLDDFQQAEVCPNGDFTAFFAREGFFEACVGGSCLREFCKVDVGGIARDVPRVYNCKPI
jgi:hypothetical protein